MTAQSFSSGWDDWAQDCTTKSVSSGDCSWCLKSPCECQFSQVIWNTRFDNFKNEILNIEQIDGIATIKNNGNKHDISYYLENHFYDTEYGKLFIAPCGLGKTKFAPAMIMKKMKAKGIVMVTERVKSAESAFEWYAKRPLSGISGYTLRAGGKSKFIGSKKGNQMRITTTNAWVDNKMKLQEGEIMMLDEAHNITAGTIAIMKTVPSSKLVRTTATPVDEGFKIDLTTPLNSTVQLRNWDDYEFVEYVEANPFGTHLMLLPTVNEVMRASDFLSKRLNRVVITATSEAILKGKQRLNFSELESVSHEANVIVATDILQESVTLGLTSIWDRGMRCRPVTDVFSKLEGNPMDNDWTPNQLIVPVTLSEIGQVAGRVGRIPRSDNGLVVIDADQPYRKHLYMPESRDTLEGKQISANDFAKWKKFYNSVKLNVQGPKPDSRMIRLFNCLEFLDVKPTMKTNFKQANDIVTSMFSSKVENSAKASDEIVEEIVEITTNEEIHDEKLVVQKDDENVTLEYNVGLGSSGTKFKYHHVKGNFHKQVSKCDVKLQFGEIEGFEFKKLRSRRSSTRKAYVETREGYCSVNLVQRKYRRQASKVITENMPLHELIKVAPLTKTKRLTFITQNVAHVTNADRYANIDQQIAYLSKIGKKVLVGLEDEFKAFVAQAVLDAADDFETDEDVDIEYVVSDPEFEEVEDKETVPIFGGDSDCWRHLARIPRDELEDSPPRTRKEILSWLQALICKSRCGSGYCKLCNRIAPTCMKDDFNHRYVKVSHVRDNLWHLEASCRSQPPCQESMAAALKKRHAANPKRLQKCLDNLRAEGGFAAADDPVPEGWITLNQFFDDGEALYGDKTSPLSNAIKNTTSMVAQEAIDGALQGKIIEEIGRSMQLCPYYVHKENQEYFNTLGIPYLAESPRTHSHPVHYAIRRNKLINVMPGYLKAPFTTVNMKETDVKLLKDKTGQDVQTRYILRDAKDFARFESHLTEDDPFELGMVKTPMIVLDQLAHYCSAQDIIGMFERSPTLQLAVLGHEFPISALFSSASPMPNLWNHRVENGVLKYKCEMDESEPYEQPFDPSLLLARTLRSADGNTILYCKVVHSHLNSHTQIVSRIPIETDEYLSVQMHDFIELMPVHRDRYMVDLVPRTLYDRMMDYAQSMANLKPTEMRAKLRTLVNPEKFWMDELTKEELITVVATIVQNTQPLRESSSKFYDSLTGKFTYNTTGRLRKWISSKFKRKYIRRWRALINAEHPLKLIPLVHLEGKAYSKGSIVQFKWNVPSCHKESFYETMKRLLHTNLSPDEFDKLQDNRDWISDPDYVGEQLKYLTINKRNIRKYSQDELKEHWIGVLAKMYGRKAKYVKPKPPETLNLNRKKQKVIPESWRNDPTIQNFNPKFTWTSDINRMDIDGHDPEADMRDEGLWFYETSDTDIETSDEIAVCTESEPEIPDGDPDSDFKVVEEDFAKVMYHDPVMPKLEEKKAVDENVPDPKPPDKTQEQIQTAFDRVVKEAGLVYEPIFPNAAPNSWWDEKYPFSAGKRYNTVPFWPPVCKKISYPKQDCLLVSFASIYRACHGKNISKEAVWALVCRCMPKDIERTKDEYGLSTEVYDVLAIHFGFNVRIMTDEGPINVGVREGEPLEIELKNFHFHNFKGIPPISITIDQPLQSDEHYMTKELLADLRKNPLIDFKPFTPDTEGADKYMFLLIAKRIGTFRDNPVNDEKLRAWDGQMKAQLKLEQSQPKQRFISVIAGDPGCGKSKPIADVLKAHKYHQLGLFTVVLPISHLRDDWSKKLDLRAKKGISQRPTNSAMCCTFEYALAKTHGATIAIFDEDKFPTGYISLFCLLKPQVKYIIFMGDPYQGSWHDPGGKADELNALDGEMQRYIRYASSYVIGTQRFDENIGNILCTPVKYTANHSGIRFTNIMPTSWADLRPIYPGVSDTILQSWWADHAHLEASNAAVDAASMMNKNDVITMSGSQGLTKKLTLIHVNITVARLVGNDILWVALSRSQRVIIYSSVVRAGSTSALLETRPAVKTLLSYKDQARAGKSVVPDPTRVIDFRRLQGGLNRNWRIVLAFPPHECRNWEQVKSFFPTLYGYLDKNRLVKLGGATFYRDIDHNDEGHMGNPFIATKRIGYKVKVRQKETTREATFPIAKLRTKLPKSQPEFYKEYVNAQVPDRFKRELWHDRYGYSRQAPEGFALREDWVAIRDNLIGQIKSEDPHMRTRSNRVVNRVLMEKLNALPDSENPLKYDRQILNWGLSQSNSDEVSYAFMMAERVRVGSEEANMKEWLDQKPYGDAMWDAWCKYVRWGSRQPLDLDRYEEAKAKFVARRAARSVAMKKMGLARADPDFPRFIVGKTQMKLKSTAIKDASALQTTLTMDDEYLFNMGHVGVYLLDCILETLPDYVYLHAKKTFGDMANFVAEYYAVDEYWESDLTQQEQSMRGGALQFTLRLMEHFSIPGEAIDYFRSMKLNTKVGRFVLALQTASGEIFTWLINTLGNGSRIALKYNLKPGDPMMLTGDDSLTNRNLRENPGWKQWEPYDFATEKSECNEGRGTFASFVVSKGRVFKNPEILLRRLMVAESRGKIKDVLPGYFIEWLSIYALSDHLHELLTDIEMEAHNILSSIIFNSRRNLKVNVKFNWDKLVGIDEDQINYKPYEVLFNYEEIFSSVLFEEDTNISYEADDEI